NLRLSVRSASQIDLAWNDNSLSEIGYRIRRRPDQVLNEVVIGIVPSNGTTTAAYSDINLKSGTTYFYTVTAYDENGESLPTTSVSARTPDAFPTPPSGVTATAISSNQVNVSWIDNSDNETSFVVQRKTGEGGFVDVSVGLPANTTSYNDKVGIQPETTYTYRLIVTNILTTGGISPIYSVNEATVTTPMAAPAAPTGFKATIVSSFQLNLAWTDLAVNESGYRLYRKIGSGEYELYQILPPGSVFFQDVGLEEGETYGYRLAAFNTIGESAPFAELTQTMPVVPGSPILVVNKKSSTSLELVWTEAGGVETGFRIFRRTGTSGNFSQIATVGANVLTFVNTGLTVSTTYQYYVTAFNEGGESDPGTPVSQTTPTIPPAPTLGTLTANSYNVVTINWTYPDSVQDLISFLIQRSGSASGPFTQVTELANPAQTSYQDTGLNSNRTYHYRVIAKTAFEQSPASAVAAVTTLDGPPEIPSNLVAKVTNGTTITLTWIDNSSNETHFKVRRSPAGTDTWTEFEPNLTVSTYVDTTPVAGQRYDYQVKAVNSLATPPDLGWTASTNAGIPASFPANPTALVASTRTPTSVSLTWELNPVSVNPETSIVLQRKLTTASENPETVATIPSAAIGSYTSNDLTEGTSYTFTVLAQNILGSSSQPATLVASTRPLAPSSLLATVDTFNSANLTWVDNSTRETGYRIYQKLVDNETYSRVEANIGPNVTTFKVTGLTSGVAYNFKVVAIKDSDESPDSEEVSLALPTQPNAPTALIAVTNQSSQATRVSQIDLAWADNSSGESGFRIERRTGFSATYELVTTVGPNVKQYSNIGLTSGTSFTYRVAAFNIGGLSNWSNEATAETEGFPPNAPSNLTATPVSGSQINLSWVDNADNELGFRVQRRQIPTSGSPGSWLTIATLNANVKTYPSTNLISGRRYAFRVTAFNNDGDATSNEAFADTLLAVPAAPTELTATAVSGLQINLAWIDNSGSEDGFRIMRKASLSGTFAELKTVPPDSRTYQDTGLTPNTRYYYQVMAYNGVGNSAPSNEASATTLVAPNAPTNLVVTVVSSTQIDLSWTDNSTNETGFRIQRRSGTVQTWIEVATVAANIRTYQNTGLSPGQTYIYRVVAYTSTSDSAPTNEASGTTPIGVPAAPSNLQAIPISTSQINLGWSDNSNNETSFTIRRKAGLSGTYTDVGTVAANTTTFQSSGLASAVTYYFVVVATNSNGNSGPSNEAFATTISGGTQVPAAPTGLTATAASSTQINLTWSDNSTNETGFRIQRRTGIDGTWSDIATTASDVTSYSDSSLTPATTYYYTVRATNAVGDSVLSNEATATTTDGSTTPLAPPADLTVTAMTVTSTRLNWRDTSTSEAGFRVQRRLGTAGAWVDAATLGANTVSYEDTGLQSNSSLTYRVIAFNETSNSDPSNEQSIVMPSFDFQPLSNDLPVTGVVSRNQSKYFRIYVPSGATELTVQTTGNNNVHLYVRFERQPNITANCRSEGPTSTELCRLPAPNPGDWHIQILGAGTTTSSNFTLTASYKGSGVTIPAAPTQLVATPVSSSQVNLTWSDNSANETGFRVRRRLATSTTWTLIHTTATPNAISYQDSSLSPGTTYVYYVTAINVAGESSSSNESSATTLSAGGTVPAAPSSLVATSVSSSQIRLTWTDNSNNETGFRVRRRTGSTGSFSDVATVAPNTATFLNTGLAANTTYFYQVIAINDFGNSSGSNESSATTSTSGGGGEIPESPTDLRVSAVSVSSVSLSWTDNSPNESGFRVERRLASGEWVLATSLGINVRTWQDVGLISGATFTYRVTAFNASGSSAPSTEKAVTIPSFNFTILTNKVGLTSSVSRSASKYFMISVPDGMAELIVETTGTFDPNLYIRHERQPTEIAYSCRSISIGPVERCRILAPQSGDWHIQIVGNSVTTSNFTVTATINEPQL
ncbi:MAG: hypothetical protein EBU88_06310, partial [Acidobacteria bacterium]|nr:hypothetical protein [Acidobacteriota bacterium]